MISYAPPGGTGRPAPASGPAAPPCRHMTRRRRCLSGLPGVCAARLRRHRGCLPLRSAFKVRQPTPCRRQARACGSRTTSRFFRITESSLAIRSTLSAREYSLLSSVGVVLRGRRWCSPAARYALLVSHRKDALLLFTACSTLTPLPLFDPPRGLDVYDFDDALAGGLCRRFEPTLPVDQAGGAPSRGCMRSARLVLTGNHTLAGTGAPIRKACRGDPELRGPKHPADSRTRRQRGNRGRLDRVAHDGRLPAAAAACHRAAESRGTPRQARGCRRRHGGPCGLDRTSPMVAAHAGAGTSRASTSG